MTLEASGTPSRVWIDELNRLLKPQRTELRAFMWEHDAVSQIGDRQQAIVNEQFADLCDIFLGIM